MATGPCFSASIPQNPKKKWGFCFPTNDFFKCSRGLYASCCVLVEQRRLYPPLAVSALTLSTDKSGVGGTSWVCCDEWAHDSYPSYRKNLGWLFVCLSCLSRITLYLGEGEGYTQAKWTPHAPIITGDCVGKKRSWFCTSCSGVCGLLECQACLFCALFWSSAKKMQKAKKNGGGRLFFSLVRFFFFFLQREIETQTNADREDALLKKMAQGKLKLACWRRSHTWSIDSSVVLYS